MKKVFFLVGVLAFVPVHAASFADVTQPSLGVNMHKAYAEVVARNAYIWGWPIINQMNR